MTFIIKQKQVSGFEMWIVTLNGKEIPNSARWSSVEAANLARRYLFGLNTLGLHDKKIS